VKKVKDIDDYQGLMIIEIHGIDLLTIYQAPSAFAESNLIVNKEIKVDLWFLDALVKTGSQKKEFPTNISEAGGQLHGRVTKVLSDYEIEIDCGKLVLNIRNEKEIVGLNVGDYIETRGSYQIFFPETEWSYEEMY
jgi:hypothetical protein